MEKIIVELNKKFDNNFTFLKIYDVEYIVSAKTCTFTLMYPETVKDILNEDRKKIYEFFKEYLNLNGKLYIKYKKSYLDKEFILKEIFLFVKKNYYSIFSYISKDDVYIENNNCYLTITINLPQNLYENIEIEKFERELQNYLNSRFCAEFAVKINQIKEVEFDGAIEKRLKKVIESNIIEKVPRYKVLEPVMLVGKEFYFEPEFIENIKLAKSSVIIAGKVQNLSKKTYTKKGKKPIEKAYYTFILNEGKSNIPVVYFCAKSNEVKMDKLANHDTVVIIGDIKNGYNGSLTMYVRSIALCELPKDIYSKSLILQNTITENGYKFVKPEKVLSAEQENLFFVGPMFNKHIYSNNFVVFDVETTGLDADTCEIIEIGAAKITDGKITEKFQTLVKPSKPISDLITTLTGIDNAMVKDAPKIQDVIKDFHYFCQNSILIGYNVSFDIKFIQNAGRLVEYNFDNKIEDAMALAREKLRLRNYKLKTVVNELGIKLENAHRAYNDALATAKVYLKLNEIKQNV